MLEWLKLVSNPTDRCSPNQCFSERSTASRTIAPIGKSTRRAVPPDKAVDTWLGFKIGSELGRRDGFPQCSTIVDLPGPLGSIERARQLERSASVHLRWPCKALGRRVMLEEFGTRHIKTAGTEIFLRHAGHGPAVLLLHGYPQTHVEWRHVAPALAKQYTVVCPDLRGYGASGHAHADPTHTAYSKRAMGNDLVEVMESLGFARFAVVGHDRGGRVAYRLALDYQARVAALCVLDIVPTSETWNRTNMARALGGFHWGLLAQPEPLPEKLIGSDPDFFMEWILRAWAAPGFVFDSEALTAYREAFRDRNVIHATCEDYRAGATIDYAHDLEDQKHGRKILCPVLALWGERDAAGKPTDFLQIWRQWADDVIGAGIKCGHFLAEEAPEELLGHLKPFLERTLAQKASTPTGNMSPPRLRG